LAAPFDVDTSLRVNQFNLWQNGLYAIYRKH
jgi:hypothetical protein